MSGGNWKPAKLNELGFVGRGKSRHRPRNAAFLYGGRYPFFQTGDIKAANFYLTEYSQTYSDEGLAQSKLWKPGTLCITIAANIAESAILGIEGCFPDSVVGFIADPDKADVRFIKYYMEILKLRMQNVSHGATQDNLSVDKLLSFDFLVPPIHTQRRIANILSAYDELIENSQRRIKILESMARALYREWFVHFRYPGHETVPRVPSPLGEIPQGWAVKKLGDLMTYDRRATKPGLHLKDRRYVPIDCLPPKSLALQEAKPIEEAQSSLQLFEKGDILFGAMRPYFHKVVVAPFPGVTRTTCFVFKPARPEWHAFATMTAFEEATVAYANAHSQGATIPYAVWDGSLSEMPLVFPSADVMQRFESLAAPILARLAQSFFSLGNLRLTRDLLLPRLLSGQIDVEAIAP